jgi:hypothetical protein
MHAYEHDPRASISDAIAKSDQIAKLAQDAVDALTARLERLEAGDAKPSYTIESARS